MYYVLETVSCFPLFVNNYILVALLRPRRSRRYPDVLARSSPTACVDHTDTGSEPHTASSILNWPIAGKQTLRIVVSRTQCCLGSTPGHGETMNTIV